MNEMFLRPYCIIGIGGEKEIEEIKKDLSFIAEPKANFVTGESMIIATFRTSLHLGEIEEFLNMNERTFIIFEMLPSMFYANLGDAKFQEALFGGEFKNLMGEHTKSFTDYVPHISKSLKEFLNEIKEELKEEDFFERKDEEEPTLDDILDRINKVGINNLTNKEKEILDKHSNNKI